MNIKLINNTHAARTNAKAQKTETKNEELFDLAILAKITKVCKSMTYSSQFGCARQLSGASCGSRGISTSLTEKEVCTPLTFFKKINPAEPRQADDKFSECVIS